MPPTASSAHPDPVNAARELLEDAWYPARGQPLAERQSAFRRVMGERRLNVAHWPEVHGGLGFPPKARYVLERELAAAGAPGPDPLQVDALGPLLIEYREDERQHELLADIRDGTTRFAVHSSALGGHGRLPSAVRAVKGNAPPQAHGILLAGGVIAVHGACQADGVLLCADVEDGGPTLAMAALEGAEAYAGGFADPDLLSTGGLEAHAIGPVGAGRSLTEFIEERLGLAPVCLAVRTSAVVARVRNRMNEEGLSDADLADALEGLEVELMGLVMLEERAVMQRSPGLARAARLRIGAARSELARIVNAGLGYHAMPVFDPATMGNEGRLGPDLCQDAIADLFRYVAVLDGVAARDRLGGLVTGGTTPSHRGG